jgi:hypothetical protein
MKYVLGDTMLHIKNCQLYDLDSIADALPPWERIYQQRHRLKRIIKRRLRYVHNFLTGERLKKEELLQTSTEESAAVLDLKPGDMVRIKSEKEIQATLNRWNSLKGCAFMEEMWPYCGTTHRIFKRVNQFLDERTYFVRKCKGVFLLDKIVCHGTKDFGPCDRSCFLFWREEWLEKVDVE